MSSTYFGSQHEIRMIDKIIAKDVELKKMLYSEINELTSKVASLESELMKKSTQFDKLKEDFLFNFSLIKERDKVIKDLENRVVVLNKNIFDRDLVISEIKIQLDRALTNLTETKTSESKLKEEFENCRNKYMKNEQELKQKHNLILNTLKQTELEERNQLENNIIRLKQDLETERLKFTNELEQSLSYITKEREKSENKLSQQIYELELRLNLSQEIINQTNQTKCEFMNELNDKQKELDEKNKTISELNKNIESITIKNQKLQTDIRLLEQKIMSIESVNLRNEKQWNENKEKYSDEINCLKSKIEWYEHEITVLNSKHEENMCIAKSKYDQLLEIVENEKYNAKKAIQLAKEEKEKCLHAEQRSRILYAESIRLRDDLNEALLKPQTELSTIPTCKHEHFLNKIENLENRCELLENENSHLKQIINIMSKQLKQVAKNSHAINDFVINKTDYDLDNISNTTDNELRTNSKLSYAIKQIQSLALEKRSLIELSNRLQAQLRRKNESKSTNQNDSDLCGDDCNINNNNLNKQTKLKSSISNTSFINSRFDTNQLLSIENKKLNESNTTFHSNSPYLDDGISSVVGKESVKAVFQLLDDGILTERDFGSNQVSRDTGLKICGESKKLNCIKINKH